MKSRTEENDGTGCLPGPNSPSSPALDPRRPSPCPPTSPILTVYSILPCAAPNPSPVFAPPSLNLRICPYTSESTNPAMVKTPPTIAQSEVAKCAKDSRVSRVMTCSGEIS